MAKYPLLQINRSNIYNNAKIVTKICNANGIDVAGVIKGSNGMDLVAEEMIHASCKQIASSRLEQLIRIKRKGVNIEFMLLRAPMQSEINKMVQNIDISLNSEQRTIELIEKACARYSKNHGVVLMVDLGDLREGFWDSAELIRLAMHIENNLRFVKLKGIGANLNCYGSVKPSSENLGRLSDLADKIAGLIGRPLEIVSGGGTTSLPVLYEGKMPAGINHLRIGEAILLNRDLPDLWNLKIPGLCQDTFVLKAQIIEIKNKPTHPVGELSVDAFGSKPVYVDRGIRKRALVAVGKQDFAMHDQLIPKDEGIEIVGSSSDHLIIDIDNCKRRLEIGDVVEFNMFYGPMLYLCGSQWVLKCTK